MPKVFQKTLEGGRIEVSEKRPPGYWHGVQRLRFSGGASPFATPGEVRKGKINWPNLLRASRLFRKATGQTRPEDLKVDDFVQPPMPSKKNGL